MMDLNIIYNEDCLEGLKKLPDGCVHTCVTSPPYYGLRDYGIDGQIGLEETPDAYVARLLAVFREVRRVLRDDGTLWLNLGDSYASGGRTYRAPDKIDDKGGRVTGDYRPRDPEGIKPKDLIGIPWRVAFALQADGWWLRQEIIWHKPNPMPESVTDRCTKSHEYIFLMAKSEKYFFDAEAIKEPAVSDHSSGNAFAGRQGGAEQFPMSGGYGSEDEWTPGGLRNRRSVWTIATKPFAEAHFATFPVDLIKPCILAGAPAGGVVIDPFMGAGTTAVVARDLGRNYIGFELNPEYIKIARKRIKAVEIQPLLLV